MNQDCNVQNKNEVMNSIAMPDYISSLDLESVKYKMMKELGWTLEKLDTVEI